MLTVAKNTLCTQVRSQQQNSSKLCIYHRSNPPPHPFVKLQISSVAETYRLRFLWSVFLSLREDLREKSGRLLCSLKLIGCFLIGPRRTVLCSLYIYTPTIFGRKFYRKCLFSLRTDIGNAFFPTNCQRASGAKTLRLDFTIIYSYFEKGCRKKCTLQSRKVLWVVLSALFFKEI